MKYITLEQLLQLHVLVIRQGGGSDGLRDLGRLEAALAAQSQEVFGEELYQTIYEKSAAMIRGIIGDHPFSDGNKRTAMLAGLTFLSINRCIFYAKPKELEDFAVQITVEHLDVQSIAAWLEKHTQTR